MNTNLQKEPSNDEKSFVALGQALQALREEETVAQLIRIVLEYLQAEFDYALVWIGLYDRAEHQLWGQGVLTPGNTGNTAFFKERFTLSPGDMLEQVVVQLRPLGIPDLREEHRARAWHPLAQKFNIQGTLVFPIRYRDSCLGVVLLGSLLWGTSPPAEEKAKLSMLLGALADALYRNQGQQQVRRPDQPLLTLLAKLRSLPDFNQRIEAVISETHDFVKPDRTTLYWYEPQHRYFWKRQSSRSPQVSFDLRILVQDVNSFYQSLSADQVVSVSEAQSSLGDLNGRLMQQIQARSLIAAPVLYQGELRGFLAVEGIEARIWSEAEKSAVRGIAQLIALTAPLEEIEETVQQIKDDQVLTAEIACALYSEEDWQNILKSCGDQLCRRLNADRFLVLLYDKDRNQFEICYQQPSHRSAIASALESLNPVDWQMLEHSTEAVSLENLEEDLKLMAWRQVFLDAEVRSLLVCSTAMGQPLEGLVVVGTEASRSWNRTERGLLRVVSQQIGLLLHQIYLQRQTERLQTAAQILQSGLTAMQQMHQLDRLEQAATQQIAHLLQAPLVALVTWQPGRTVGQVTAPAVSKRPFDIAVDLPIPIYTDLLVQWALQSNELLRVERHDLTPETRQWLYGEDIGQVMVMALRTATEHEPTGIILVADRVEQRWTGPQLAALGTLARQLAWGRRYLSLTEVLSQQKATLQQLNWYKQRRLEETYRALSIGIRRLKRVQDESGRSFLQPLGSTLSSTLIGLTPAIKHEQWQLQKYYETMPLTDLVGGAMERLDSQIKQRQLQAQIHYSQVLNESKVSVGGDIPKIEFVLLEVLASACQRSPVGTRLDVWCRQLDAQWVELLITDHGIVEPRLLEELENRSVDRMAPSTLEHPPGLHLAICKSILAQLGSELSLYRLADGRTVSRLVLSIAVGSSLSLLSQSEGETTAFR